MYKRSWFSFTAQIIRTAMRTTRMGDWCIVVFSLACVFLLGVFAWRGSSSARKKPYVEITTSKGTFLYQLEQQRSISIDGPLGKTVVVIDKKVDVIQSPGRRQICVNAKPIFQHGQWLACLPNRVFLRIYGNPSKTQESAVDGLSF